MNGWQIPMSLAFLISQEIMDPNFLLSFQASFLWMKYTVFVDLANDDDGCSL